MSTEHQRYSTANQSDAIRQYAERRGLHVIRTYADEGKSGLRLDGRDALKRLIEDVQNQKPISPPSWSTTSAAGAVFRTPTRAPITNTSAAGQGLRSNTVRSSSRMMAARSRPSSRASSARWLASTAESYLRKSLPDNAG